VHIGILETGFVPEELIAAYGQYPNMFKTLLRNTRDSYTFSDYCVLQDQFPAHVTDCDAWLITGSKHGVYENTPWMQRLIAFIQDAYAQGVKLIGICFGHQIIAAALGGTVEKSEKGWGIGLHTYQLSAPIPHVENTSETVAINCVHQDQVIEKPADATVFASSDFCPYAGLFYGDKALTLQPHPEFAPDYEKDLLELRADDPIPAAQVSNAVQHMAASSPPEQQRVARWIDQFLHGAKGA
jgi:GMP synthase-like glutamine amidotransferase